MIPADQLAHASRLVFLAAIFDGEDLVVSSRGNVKNISAVIVSQSRWSNFKGSWVRPM
jgi:hypothetical protein